MNHVLNRLINNIELGVAINNTVGDKDAEMDARGDVDCQLDRLRLGVSNCELDELTGDGAEVDALINGVIDTMPHVCYRSSYSPHHVYFGDYYLRGEIICGEY